MRVKSSNLKGRALAAALALVASLLLPSITGAGGSVGAEAGGGESSPRIQFAQTHYDFGDLKMGPAATHVFTFRNTGDAELKLLPPQAS